MPGMSGIEFYKHLQKEIKSLAKRTVFITGDGMAADTGDFLSEARALYLAKPFNTVQLKKELRRILVSNTECGN